MLTLSIQTETEMKNISALNSTRPTLSRCTATHTALLTGFTITVYQWINSSICKAPLKQSSQRHLLWAGLQKESGLKAWFELFLANVYVLEMRWQHVASLGSNERHGNCEEHNAQSEYMALAPSVFAVSRAKPGAEGDEGNLYTKLHGNTRVIGHIHINNADTHSHQCLTQWLMLTVTLSLCPHSHPFNTSNQVQPTQLMQN